MQWSKKKTKVANRAREMATQVLLLYAKRENTTRSPCDPQYEEEEYQKRVVDSFEYEPTEDQQRAFDDVMQDMVWRKRPMDRLIVGYVGSAGQS